MSSSEAGVRTRVRKATGWIQIAGVIQRVPLWLALVVGARLALAQTASAQTAIPDAQIEANVLRALAGESELANERITTRSVYGTVTLSGSVLNEERRLKAENLAARATGVLKVVDELQLGEPTNDAVSGDSQKAGGEQGQSSLVLRSDGSYGPAQATTNDSRTEPEAESGQAGRNSSEPRGDRTAQPDVSSDQPLQHDPAQGRSTRSEASQASSSASGEDWDPEVPRRPIYRSPYSYPPAQYSPRQFSSSDGLEGGGQAVLIPNQTMLRVRINRTLSSDRSQPGMVFDGIVINDVVAGGVVAVPRGATVQGRVVETHGSGVLKGRGEMSIELTHLVLGGHVYPIRSDRWAQHGGDKTLETVNKTAGFGAVGALIGAIAGGGVGAAVGGGVGAAAGLGSSAASGNGQVVLPTESILTFHLAQDASVETVSMQEMQRLAYGVAPGAEQGLMRRRPYPAVYVGPWFSPRYYPGPYYRGPYGPYGPAIYPY